MENNKKKKKEDTKQYSLRLPEELLEKIRVLSKKKCRSMNDQIKKFTIEGVEAFEKEYGKIKVKTPKSKSM